MIIDQLPLLSGDVQATDEIPIERGTTTYKTTPDKFLGALPTDATPTQGSTNPVQSGGVYSALQNAGGALYITNVAVSVTAGNIATVSNSAITANHVVAECVFADPSYITTDVTWTTSAGSLVLNGTCTTATTANIVLVKKDN